MNKNLKVTFYCFSKVLNKEFINVEFFNSMADAKLFASAMHWTIQKTEKVA